MGPKQKTCGKKDATVIDMLKPKLNLTDKKFISNATFFSLALLLTGWFATCMLWSQSPLPRGIKLTPYAVIEHHPVNETSGLVLSPRYPNTLWIHNDSGDIPRLFAINSQGKVLFPAWMEKQGYITGKPTDGKRLYPGLEIRNASNIDWESVTVDRQDDILYICDLGNNGNARRDLGIYVLPEPNPQAVKVARILKWIPVAYPDQNRFPPLDKWEFDCEASFCYQHKLYFLTKHRPAFKIGTPLGGTKLYRLDTQYTDRINMLTYIERKDDLEGWVTDADISPDERLLAILCQAPIQSVWLFDTPSQGDKFLSSKCRRLIFHGAGQCEGIAFLDNKKLLLCNEQQQLFLLKIQDFTPVSR